MAAMRSAAIVLLALTVPTVAVKVGATTKLSVNPIRRVVTMLQMMQKKVVAEGKTEKELYDKYMCWCSTGASDLEKAIADAETKIPQLEASIKELMAAKGGLLADVEQAKADKAEAKAAVAQAKALREKESAAFAKESTEAKANILALKQAIAAIEKGMEGAFLQTKAATVLRRITVTFNMGDSDRDLLSSFLAQGQTEDADYAPQSGEIVGILKQMQDTMEKDLADSIVEEQGAIANFQAMLKAKTAQIEACTKEIEEKLVRIGDSGVELENLKEDLEDTTESLAEDKKFLADLAKNCETKKAEWEERSKVRADELLALADTIKILNDDDALDLFKKTLPSPSLLQLKVTSKAMSKEALKALRGGAKDTRVQLISMALRSGKVSFEKVIGMIDEMVVLLGKEQAADDDKKAYCEAELDKAEDEAKQLDIEIDDLEKALETAKETVATLATEIKDLVDGIKELDKAVAEATATRKEEHEDYVSELAANTAAKDIIGIAKNRMQKFYNPKLYVPPAKRELTAEERISMNLGGTMAPTNPPGGIAGTGVTAFVQVRAHTAREAEDGAPPPPPETFGAYTKKSSESGGVLAMMDILVADLDKEIQESEVEEKNAQAEYEEFIANSAAKRAADAKSITEKEAAKAGLEAEIEQMTLEKKGKMEEAMAKGAYIKDLHLECDWLLENFEVRKTARAGEVEALKQAKAVLSGADYSLVQTKVRRHLRRVAH